MISLCISLCVWVGSGCVAQASRQSAVGVAAVLPPALYASNSTNVTRKLYSAVRYRATMQPVMQDATHALEITLLPVSRSPPARDHIATCQP